MNKPVSYLQTDPRWAATDYSTKGEKTTIGESGCGPTCMAMVISTLTGKAVTPIDTCKWAKEHGYKALNQGTYYSYFAPQGRVYGIDVKQLNGINLYKKDNTAVKNFHKKALDEVKKGNMVVACMGKGLWTNSGHFVLWYGMEGSRALINDPYSTNPKRTNADLALFQSQVKYYFIIYSSIYNKVEKSSHSQNYYAVQERYGFSDTTMAYLEAFTWADSLFAMMLQDKHTQRYQLNTIRYLLEYKYGDEIFKKLEGK